jgi:hypothetical protein
VTAPTLDETRALGAEILADDLPGFQTWRASALLADIRRGCDLVTTSLLDGDECAARVFARTISAEAVALAALVQP